jgi:ribosomal-protein-serine acetyltransferase
VTGARRSPSPLGGAPHAPPQSLAIPSRGAVRQQPIETQRLILSPIDTSASSEMWEAIDASRWHLERWLPWVPYNDTPEAVVRHAEASASEWDAGRSLRFVIRDRSTRRLLGVVGLDACIHVHRSCELGYWLRQDATGRGLMTEAAQACVDFGFRQVGAHRIRCAAATENYPSLRVIQRLGFRFEGLARQAEYVAGRFLDHAVFARLSTDD